jgi:uncharacterized protein involved in exopolysaccharide biosynthesis
MENTNKLIINNDEISLSELVTAIWSDKWKVFFITVAFTLLAVIYSLSLPNKYTAKLVVAPAQNEAKSGLGGLASQYSGLAAMAGINLGGGDSSRINQAIELMRSWPFLEGFYNKYNLKPLIMGVKGWDKVTNKLVYDEEVYNPEENSWIAADVDDKDPEPSSWETYKVIKEMLSISLDDETGMLTIYFTHYSPEIANSWVKLLKQEINSFYQKKDMAESKKNIDYLKSKISQTSVTDMQVVFYNMIESQTQTLMLAEVSDAYLFKTVVPSTVPQVKSSPKRLIMVIVGLFCGASLSLMWIFVRFFTQRSKNIL